MPVTGDLSHHFYKLPSVIPRDRSRIQTGHRRIAPRQTLAWRGVFDRLGQLRHGESFFDYGCGHGGDVDAVGKLGHPSGGWDPVHAPDAPKQSADVVNLGFVLNVIEDPAERVEALLDAWQHARRVLLVSTLIAGQEAYDDIRTYGDGVLTSRDTFQKFFEPAEIQALLEDTLHTEAVPVGLGIYLVFRDTAEFHDFLASRSPAFH